MTRGGDHRAATFHAEALPHMDAVYRFALRLSGVPDQADDLTQETFLRAWRSWESYATGTNVRSWLFTICRNVFLRGEERGKRHGEIVEQLKDEDPRAISRETTIYLPVKDRDPEGAFWNGVVDGKILDAIRALPDEFRDAILLSDLEGLSYREVAETLGVAEGTVKSRLFRGRRMLQRELLEYAMEAGIVRAGAAAGGGVRERKAT